MQWHTLQQDWGKTRQGKETRREEAGERRKVVWRVHAEAKKKRKRGKERGERGGQDGKTGCISPLPACAPAMPSCHAAA